MATRKTPTRTTRTRPAPRPAGDDPARTIRLLERRVKRLEADLQARDAEHERKLAAARRAADRRLAAMMREIAQLRHHEARAALLERLLAEREAAGTAPAAPPDSSAIAAESGLHPPSHEVG